MESYIPSFYLPQFISDKIFSIHIPTDSLDDQVLWHITQSSSFSTKSAHTLLISSTPVLNSETIQSKGNCNWLWKKTTCLPKIKTFLWLCSLGKLKCNYTLFKRKITSSLLCSFCSLDETILYILRDCKIAKKHLDFYLNQIQHIHSFSLHSDPLTWL